MSYWGTTNMAHDLDMIETALSSLIECQSINPDDTDPVHARYAYAAAQILEALNYATTPLSPPPCNIPNYTPDQVATWRNNAAASCLIDAIQVCTVLLAEHNGANIRAQICDGSTINDQFGLTV